MKPVTFVAVNGKSPLPVAAPPRRDPLTVPVWHLSPLTVQRRCNTAFDFGFDRPQPLDKNADRPDATLVCITQEIQIQIRFRLGLGASK
jgi:hypothetical protein